MTFSGVYRSSIMKWVSKYSLIAWFLNINNKILDVSWLLFDLLIEHGSSLGNIPILTKSAFEITTNCSYREDLCTWKEVVERLLLHWINVESTGITVDGQIEFSIFIVANIAFSVVVFGDNASPIAAGAGDSIWAIFALLEKTELEKGDDKRIWRSLKLINQGRSANISLFILLIVSMNLLHRQIHTLYKSHSLGCILCIFRLKQELINLFEWRKIGISLDWTQNEEDKIYWK